MVRLTDRLDMTIAVDWDVTPQTKQKQMTVRPDLLITAAIKKQAENGCK